MGNVLCFSATATTSTRQGEGSPHGAQCNLSSCTKSPGQLLGVHTHPQRVGAAPGSHCKQASAHALAQNEAEDNSAQSVQQHHAALLRSAWGAPKEPQHAQHAQLPQHSKAEVLQHSGYPACPELECLMHAVARMCHAPYMGIALMHQTNGKCWLSHVVHTDAFRPGPDSDADPQNLPWSSLFTNTQRTARNANNVQHVIASSEFGPRQQQLPAPWGPQLCWFVAAPLLTNAGVKLGWVCVMDTVPGRRVDAGLCRLLANIGEMAVRCLERHICLVHRLQAAELELPSELQQLWQAACMRTGSTGSASASSLQSGPRVGPSKLVAPAQHEQLVQHFKAALQHEQRQQDSQQRLQQLHSQPPSPQTHTPGRSKQLPTSVCLQHNQQQRTTQALNAAEQQQQIDMLHILQEDHMEAGKQGEQQHIPVLQCQAGGDISMQQGHVMAQGVEVAHLAHSHHTAPERKQAGRLVLTSTQVTPVTAPLPTKQVQITGLAVHAAAGRSTAPALLLQARNSSSSTLSKPRSLSKPLRLTETQLLSMDPEGGDVLGHLLPPATESPSSGINGDFSRTLWQLLMDESNQASTERLPGLATHDPSNEMKRGSGSTSKTSWNNSKQWAAQKAAQTTQVKEETPEELLLLNAVHRQMRVQQDVLTSCSLVVDTTQPGWPVLYCNDSWKLWSGLSRHQTEGQPLQSLLAPARLGTAGLRWPQLQEQAQLGHQFVLCDVAAVHAGHAVHAVHAASGSCDSGQVPTRRDSASTAAGHGGVVQRAQHGSLESGDAQTASLVDSQSPESQDTPMLQVTFTTTTDLDGTAIRCIHPQSQQAHGHVLLHEGGPRTSDGVQASSRDSSLELYHGETHGSEGYAISNFTLPSVQGGSVAADSRSPSQPGLKDDLQITARAEQPAPIAPQQQPAEPRLLAQQPNTILVNRATRLASCSSQAHDMDMVPRRFGDSPTKAGSHPIQPDAAVRALGRFGPPATGSYLATVSDETTAVTSDAFDVAGPPASLSDVTTAAPERSIAGSHTSTCVPQTTAVPEAGRRETLMLATPQPVCGKPAIQLGAGLPKLRQLAAPGQCRLGTVLHADKVSTAPAAVVPVMGGLPPRASSQTESEEERASRPHTMPHVKPHDTGPHILSAATDTTEQLLEELHVKDSKSRAVQTLYWVNEARANGIKPIHVPDLFSSQRMHHSASGLSTSIQGSAAAAATAGAVVPRAAGISQSGSIGPHSLGVEASSSRQQGTWQSTCRSLTLEQQEQAICVDTVSDIDTSSYHAAGTTAGSNVLKQTGHAAPPSVFSLNPQGNHKPGYSKQFSQQHSCSNAKYDIVRSKTGHASMRSDNAGADAVQAADTQPALGHGCLGSSFNVSFHPLALHELDNHAPHVLLPPLAPMSCAASLVGVYVVHVHPMGVLPAPEEPLLPGAKVNDASNSTIPVLAQFLWPGLRLGNVLGYGAYGAAFAASWHQVEVVVKVQDLTINNAKELADAQLEVELGQELGHTHVVATLSHAAVKLPRSVSSFTISARNSELLPVPPEPASAPATAPATVADTVTAAAMDTPPNDVPAEAAAVAATVPAAEPAVAAVAMAAQHLQPAQHPPLPQTPIAAALDTVTNAAGVTAEATAAASSTARVLAAGGHAAGAAQDAPLDVPTGARLQANGLAPVPTHDAVAMQQQPQQQHANAVGLATGQHSAERITPLPEETALVFPLKLRCMQLMEFCNAGSLQAAIDMGLLHSVPPRITMSHVDAIAGQRHPLLNLVHSGNKDQLRRSFETSTTMVPRQGSQPIRQKLQPNLKQLLWLAMDVCSALVHLHAHGVVHADLSANNVLLMTCPPRKGLTHKPSNGSSNGEAGHSGSILGASHPSWVSHLPSWANSELPASSSAGFSYGAGLRSAYATASTATTQGAAAEMRSVRAPVADVTLYVKNESRLAVGSAPTGADDIWYMAKVSDLGKSRLVGPEGSLQVNSYATITHMAPEVLQHKQLSPASDVYSLGVILWQMYTGKRAWRGLSHQQVHDAVVSGQTLTWPTDTSPPALAELGRACCTADPAKRPPATQLLHRLQELLPRT